VISVVVIAFVGVHGEACEQSFKSTPVGDAYRIAPESMHIPVDRSHTELAQSASAEQARQALASQIGAVAGQSLACRHSTQVPPMQNWSLADCAAPGHSESESHVAVHVPLAQ
jgi:hypothetical protein